MLQCFMLTDCNLVYMEVWKWAPHLQFCRLVSVGEQFLCDFDINGFHFFAISYIHMFVFCVIGSLTLASIYRVFIHLANLRFR